MNDTAPVKLPGTAFGIFNLVSGLALLLASIIAGVLWSASGGSATFLGGAALAATAALGSLAYRVEPQEPQCTKRAVKIPAAYQ